MRLFKRGDIVTVEGRIYGAKVVKVEYRGPNHSPSQIRVRYHDPREGKVIRWVPASVVSN